MSLGQTSFFTSLWQSFVKTIGSRRRVVEISKTMLVVVPLTLLIWVYAERAQTLSDSMQINVDLVPADTNLAATIDEPLMASIRIDISGPRTQIDEFKRSIELKTTTDGRLAVPMPPGYSEGEITLDVATLLNSNSFDRAGVKVDKATPSTVRVRLDRYIDREVTVAMPRELTVTLQAVTFEPPRVLVRGPRTTIDADFPNSDSTIPIELSSIASVLSVTGVHRVESVPLKQSPNTRLTIRPQRVNASFEVGSSEREWQIPSVPIAVQRPAGQDGRYTVKLNGPPVITNVRIKGPSSILARFESRELKLTPVLKVTQEDVRSDDLTREVDFPELPAGVSVVSRPHMVSFRVEATQ